jgi:hypothetical protein
MDDDFMHMYLHGLEIAAYLFLPRFFTHGADYPEKYVSTTALMLCYEVYIFYFRMLMTCLKFLAQCPCPRCLILKSKTPRLGMKADMRDRVKLERVDNERIHRDIDLVRKWLFVDGTSMTSVAIERILQPTSLVPTRVGLSFRFR